MKILLTNDDGIASEGLLRLAKTATRFGEVWVVAPSSQCSAMSHRITLHSEVAVRKVAYPLAVAGAYSVSGTPADCVKVALHHILPFRPDLVFSGMNFGYNVGFDIAYSGTVGAAMEGLLNGIPSIAFSNEDDRNFETAEHFLPSATEEILAKPKQTDAIWNVNFPARVFSMCKGILWERTVAKAQYYVDEYEEVQGEEGKFLALKGVLTDRARIADGTDIAAVMDGYVSIGTVRSNVLTAP